RRWSQCTRPGLRGLISWIHQKHSRTNKSRSMDSHCLDFHNPAPLHVLHVPCRFVLGVRWWYSHDSYQSVVKYLFVEVTLASCIMVIVSMVRPRISEAAHFTTAFEAGNLGSRRK